jgi:hypothetical protein
MDIQSINERINNETCHDTLKQLADEALLSEYKNSKSFKNAILKHEMILSRYLDDELTNKLLQDADYIKKLIPSGTKGVIKGNTFNRIVKEYLLHLGLDPERFELAFEEESNFFNQEKPDWYILEKPTQRIIIGMNQLDLWSGGHQSNRGSKYLDDKYNTDNLKLVCVVAHHIQFVSSKNKKYKIFEKGFPNNTLCYLKNLSNIIHAFFNLNMIA